MRSDTDIHKLITDELQLESLVDVDDFDIKVKDNVVVMTGVVPSYSKKLLAERVVARMAEGFSITNALEVRKPDEQKTQFARTHKLGRNKASRKFIENMDSAYTDTSSTTSHKFSLDGLKMKGAIDAKRARKN